MVASASPLPRLSPKKIRIDPTSPSSTNFSSPHCPMSATSKLFHFQLCQETPMAKIFRKTRGAPDCSNPGQSRPFKYQCSVRNKQNLLIYCATKDDDLDKIKEFIPTCNNNELKRLFQLSISLGARAIAAHLFDVLFTERNEFSALNYCVLPFICCEHRIVADTLVQKFPSLYSSASKKNQLNIFNALFESYNRTYYNHSFSVTLKKMIFEKIDLKNTEHPLFRSLIVLLAYLGRFTLCQMQRIHRIDSLPLKMKQLLLKDCASIKPEYAQESLAIFLFGQITSRQELENLFPSPQLTKLWDKLIRHRQTRDFPSRSFRNAMNMDDAKEAADLHFVSNLKHFPSDKHPFKGPGNGEKRVEKWFRRYRPYISRCFWSLNTPWPLHLPPTLRMLPFFPTMLRKDQELVLRALARSEDSDLTVLFFQATSEIYLRQFLFTQLIAETSFQLLASIQKHTSAQEFGELVQSCYKGDSPPRHFPNFGFWKYTFKKLLQEASGSDALVDLMVRTCKEELESFGPNLFIHLLHELRTMHHNNQYPDPEPIATAYKKMSG